MGHHQRRQKRAWRRDAGDVVQATVVWMQRTCRFEENEMKSNKGRQRGIAPAGIAIGIAVQIVAVGNLSQSAESAVKPAGPEIAVQSQWDDEPVERLEPAPKTGRTSREYSWEQQYARTDAKGGSKSCGRRYRDGYSGRGLDCYDFLRAAIRRRADAGAGTGRRRLVH